jgi:hypothetical protein
MLPAPFSRRGFLQAGHFMVLNIFLGLCHERSCSLFRFYPSALLNSQSSRPFTSLPKLPKGGNTLKDPKHGHAADGIGRHKPGPAWWLNPDASEERQETKHGGDEQQLTRFDANVEEQQRFGDVPLRQAHFA